MTEAQSSVASAAATPTFASLLLGSVRRLGEPPRLIVLAAQFALALICRMVLSDEDPLGYWPLFVILFASIAPSALPDRVGGEATHTTRGLTAQWLDLAARHTVNATLLLALGLTYFGTRCSQPLLTLAAGCLALSFNMLTELALSKWTAPAMRGLLPVALLASAVLWFLAIQGTWFAPLLLPTHILNLGAALAIAGSTGSVVAAVIVTRRRLRT